MAFTYLLMFVGSWATCLVLTRWVRDVALRRGLVAIPTDLRHLHSRPIPRLGGVAIYCAFVLTSGMIAVLGHFGATGVHVPPQLRAILLAGTVVFLLGLWDDLRSLSPWVKIAGECGAAALLYAGGVRIVGIGLLHTGHPFGATVSLLLTTAWVVWITNAFNLLDGLDGLAAGSAFFSTTVMFVVSLVNDNAIISFVTLVLAGAVLGFLRFNFNPATIFLGDCGSLLIGFLLSAIAITGSHMSSMVVAIAIPVVSFGLPVMDTTLAVVRRFMSGKPLFGADGEHIHHKLLKRGLSQREAVMVLYGVSGLFGLLSLSLLYPNGRVVGLMLIILACAVFLFLQELGYHEFVELRRIAQRTIEQKRVVVNNLAIRRASEALRSSSSFADIARVLDAALRDNDFDELKLTLQAPSSMLCLEVSPPFRIDPSGCCEYQWKRRDALQPNEAPPSWALSIALRTESGAPGAVQVVRHDPKRPLMIDVNLFTATGFDRAIGEALERAMAGASREAGLSGPIPFVSDLRQIKLPART